MRYFSLEAFSNAEIRLVGALEMARRQVTCINKRGSRYNAHERIQNIGNQREGWKLSENDATRVLHERQWPSCRRNSRNTQWEEISEDDGRRIQS